MTDDDDLRAELEMINEVLRLISEDFDSGGFASHMASDDTLALVLRAHLWVERDLIAIIESPLPRADLLKVSWTFTQRLELVAALGIIDEEWLPAYRFLNALRNRLAHSLDFALGESEQRQLLGLIPESTRKSVVGDGGDAFPAPLRRALQSLVFTLKWHRHGVVSRAAASMRNARSE